MELVWKWLKLLFPLQVEPACVEVLLREDAQKMLAEKPTDFIGNKICQKRNAPCHPKAIFEVPWPALCQLVVMNRHEERSAASIIFFTGKHCSGGQSCYNFFLHIFVGHFGSCSLRKKSPEKIRCFRFTAAYSEFASVAHQPDILIALRVWVVHIICSKRWRDLSSKSHQTPRCCGGRHQMPRTRTDAK